jgi:hypothetical protein
LLHAGTAGLKRAFEQGRGDRRRGDAKADQKEQIKTDGGRAAILAHDCHIPGERDRAGEQIFHVFDLGIKLDDFERDLLRHSAQEEACFRSPRRAA